LSIFAISDLHLSLGTNKPMDVFGWDNYVERISANWKRLVKENDTVVIPGDISWALKLEEALEDFKFLETLPGKKLILKGNHDLWWSTAKKVYEFFEKNSINSVELVFNGAVVAEDRAICGSRGWLFGGGEDDKKIVARECGRLERSLSAAKDTGYKPLVFMHYPPAYGDEVIPEFIDILKRFEVDAVYYGHIHGKYDMEQTRNYDGIDFTIVSADYLKFNPLRIV